MACTVNWPENHLFRQKTRTPAKPGTRLPSSGHRARSHDHADRQERPTRSGVVGNPSAIREQISDFSGRRKCPRRVRGRSFWPAKQLPFGGGYVSDGCERLGVGYFGKPAGASQCSGICASELPCHYGPHWSHSGFRPLSRRQQSSITAQTLICRAGAKTKLIRRRTRHRNWSHSLRLWVSSLPWQHQPRSWTSQKLPQPPALAGQDICLSRMCPSLAQSGLGCCSSKRIG
jgi:hypothetical protein